jgi:hypothetical protein
MDKQNEQASGTAGGCGAVSKVGAQRHILRNPIAPAPRIQPYGHGLGMA